MNMIINIQKQSKSHKESSELMRYILNKNLLQPKSKTKKAQSTHKFMPNLDAKPSLNRTKHP